MVSFKQAGRRDGNLTNRQIKARQTRAKIIAAAEKLIKERGFDAVGVLDITNEAEVAKGSFYSYFKRKEDVMSEIAYANFDSIRDRAVLLNSGAAERIAAFLTDSIVYIRDTGLKVCQQWVKGVVDPADTGGARKLAYDRGVIRDILEAAVAGGELSPETPVEPLANGISAAYYGIVFCWALTDGAFDPAEATMEYCESSLRRTLKAYRDRPEGI